MCSCITDTNDKLIEKGFQIAKGHSCIQMPAFEVAYCLPLERADGSKLKAGDPKQIMISHCPFCGQAFAATGGTPEP